MAFVSHLPAGRVGSRNPFSCARTCCGARMSVAAEVVFKVAGVGAAAYLTQLALPVVEGTPFTSWLRRHDWPEYEETSSAESPPGALEQMDKAASTVTSGVDSIVEAARGDHIVSLIVCILIDLVGSGGLALPLVGDFLDVATAPLSAMVLYGILGDPRFCGALLAEELLPGSDVIPTATLAWVASRYISLEGHDAGRISWEESVKSGLSLLRESVGKVSSDISGKNERQGGTRS